MPYLRVSRDRSGYEHVYLLHQEHRGSGRPLLLYWFRTPPGAGVGRQALDSETVALLDAAHPEVVFDWPRLRQSLQSARANVRDEQRHHRG